MERQLSDAMGRLQPLSASKNASATTQWRFACQKRNCTLYLHLLELSLYDEGSTAIAKLRDEYSRIKREAPYNMWDRDGIFWSPAVQVAVLSEVTADRFISLTIEELLTAP